MSEVGQFRRANSAASFLISAIWFFHSLIVDAPTPLPKTAEYSDSSSGYPTKAVISSGTKCVLSNAFACSTACFMLGEPKTKALSLSMDLGVSP